MTAQIQRGFTLLESVMVIVITGIIAATAAIFIKPAIDSYSASVHRAELTDAVDTALRRLARDVRTAVPNSLREHSDQCLEYAPIIAAGRYLREGADALSFDTEASQFAVLQMTPPTVLDGGEQIVIYNLGQDVADLYAPDPNNNRATVKAGSTTALIQLKLPGKRFPLASPTSSFQVVPKSGPVALICRGTGASGNNGTGQLVMLSNYGYLPAGAGCPAATASTTMTTTLLVDRVSDCAFDYTPEVLRRHGLLTVSLSLLRDGETVNLVHQIHVDNVP